MGREVSPERVIVTTGSSGGFPLAFLASFDAGDRVALAAPGYPAYRNILTALNLEAVDLPTSAADRFQPTVAALEKAGRIDGLIVASPTNPTGRWSNPCREGCREWFKPGVRLISDEIYHGIVYEGNTCGSRGVGRRDRGQQFLEVLLDDRLAGRLAGRAARSGPANRRLAQNFSSSRCLRLAAPRWQPSSAATNSMAMSGATAQPRPADGGICRGRLRSSAPAQGAFYLYADVSHLTNDSREFCSRMLREAGVATTPGVDFDRARGAGRCAYRFAGSTAKWTRPCAGSMEARLEELQALRFSP
jgi:aspartate/methionine/tyrosine aminotransferase